MNISISIPTKAQIMSGGFEIHIAANGTSWSKTQLGDYANNVHVNYCCCSVNNATWAANTEVFYNGDVSAPVYTVTTLSQILAHEDIHGASDDAVAAKALPVAITYLKSTCTQKGFWYAAVSGGWDWSTTQCKDEMQNQANAAASYLQTLAYGTLNTAAHSYIGATEASWNPSGVPGWSTWFSGWLSGNFNGGKYW
jgi:hypothetical protein